MIRTSDTDGARWTSDLHRRNGYLEGLARHDLPHDPDLVVTAPYGVDAGAVGMEQLLSLAAPPTAAFCYSDDIAVAATAALRRHGLRVPEDMSLIGVDGHDLGKLFGITTIDQHVAEQARAASTMASTCWSGELEQPRLTLPTHLWSGVPPRPASPGPPQ